MRTYRERLLMGLLFAGLPVLLYALVIRPATLRFHRLHERIRAADEACRDVQAFTPVTQAERAFLEEPAAAWRTRVPLLDGDGARLAHANRVVSDLSVALKGRGLRAAAMRAAWEPIEAQFTLPGPVAKGPRMTRVAGDAPEHTLAGWALEVELPGPTGQLFKALGPLAQVDPLLEPVGLRWELAGPARHRQVLFLRNYYLQP